MHIFLITEEPCYPFLPCGFTVALVGFAVFFLTVTCLHTLILVSLCIRSSSSKDT